MTRCASVLLAVLPLAALGLVALVPAGAQDASQFASADEARSALQTARDQQRGARARGERLEQQAAQSSVAADRALQQSAAIAARIQQAEAGVAAAEAELALISTQRRAIDRNLAARREPLVRLTGALQAMAQRPMMLAVLQPGSLRDLVYTRAVLDSAVPQVRARTAGLRRDLDRARALQRESGEALAAMRLEEQTLAARRRDLVALAGSERTAARRAAGDATREAARALVLAEKARDLDALVGTLEAAGSLREQLAALPGPMPRPAQPGATRASLAQAPAPSLSATAPPAGYQLPTTGRVLIGFGEKGETGARQLGLVMVPRAGAQVVAPGAGRVAFAGPYRGYGHIVIIEHAGGWTSLVTGLDTLDTEVGARVTAGSPLGLAPRTAPRIALELRHDGTPVNPLDHAR